MEYCSTIKKNGIVSFGRDVDGSRDCHTEEQDVRENTYHTLMYACEI